MIATRGRTVCSCGAEIAKWSWNSPGQGGSTTVVTDGCETCKAKKAREQKR